MPGVLRERAWQAEGPLSRASDSSLPRELLERPGEWVSVTHGIASSPYGSEPWRIKARFEGWADRLSALLERSGQSCRVEFRQTGPYRLDARLLVDEAP